MHFRTLKPHFFLVLIALIWAFAGVASAQISLNTTNAFLRAKAAPDECYIALGKNIPFTKPPCFFTREKVNQGYVWGAAISGDNVWFGTVSNPQCITQGGLFPAETLIPYETEAWVCEFGESPYVPALLPALVGDFRPPQIFVYNRVTKVQTELTPKAPVGPANPLGLDPLVYATRGFRSAAIVGNLVLIGGPSLLGGLNFFAFRADTKEYLGSGVVPGFDNIRQMLVHNGQLYLPVGSNLLGGKVLRWTGSISAKPCASCFQFETVGNLDGIGAYIAAHEGRFFVTTWPTGQPNVVSGLHMSPPIPAGGLTPAHASGWTKVWDATQYEPDRTIASAYAGGAVASFDGYLYWGTMHVPWFATAIHVGLNGTPPTDQAWLAATIGTFRTTTLLRGRNFSAADKDIQLLYGLPALPKFVPPALGGGPAGRWDVVDNNMPAGKKTPLYGPPGFGNWYNNYTWQMAVWDNRLWVGTMDWGHTAEQGSKQIFKGLGQPVPVEFGAFFALQPFGADLYFFQSSASPAVPESVSGLGNFTSYGVRALLPSATNLFVGIANPSNLLTGPIGPKGGWELLELEKKPGSAPLNLLTGFTCQPAELVGPGISECTVTLSKPSTGAGVSIGLFPILFDATVSVPQQVPVPAGQTSARFNVQVGESLKAATLYLIANLNGGTMVSTISVKPGVPRLSGLVKGKGRLPSGQMYVDVQFTNTGTGTAQIVSMTQLVGRALAGTGAVTHAVGPGLSPPLPTSLGSLAPRATTDFRIFLNVPATVTRFSLTENGTIRSLAGTNYTFSIGQSIIP